MVGICKRFGAVLANVNVELRVRVGTVHGIVGENGAGKSTLMSVLYGFYLADSGRIEVFGKATTIGNADQAIALGLGMVHQHFMLVDTLSALDNILLGAEPHWLLARAQAQVRAKLDILMQSTGLHVDLDKSVGDLAVGDRQRLEILKALYRGAKILILDEPTAVLTPKETLQLFDVLRVLRSQGTTILLITHKLREVMALCDHVTVMRAGRVVQELPIAESSIEGLAKAMVGRKVNLGRLDQAPRPVGNALLQATDISLRDGMNVTRLSHLNLQLRSGEIVGVAGVSGNGQSELLDVLCGLQKPSEGTLTLNGRQFDSAQWLDPLTARELGLATAVGVGASISLAMAAVLLQGAVLVRTGLTLRALRQRLGFGTRRLLRALGPSTGVALAAGLLTAAAAWACRQAGAPALVTLGCGAVVVGAAALGAAIAIGHPLGQEVRRALAGRGRRTGSA